MGASIKVELAEKFVPKNMRGGRGMGGGGRGRGGTFAFQGGQYVLGVKDCFSRTA